MVDPVGSKAVQGIERRLQPVAPVSAVRATASAVQADAARAAPTTMQALSAPAAATPPVDVERVARIKKAIADGNFPLVPSTVADRLLALKLQWNPHEPA